MLRLHDLAPHIIAQRRIRRAEEDPAVVRHGRNETLRDVGDRIAVEVDQDVAAEDHVHAPHPARHRRIGVRREIQIAKLDIAAQLEVLELLTGLARGGTTVLAALHDLSLAAAHADAVVVLSHGRVVASGATPSTLTPALVHDVFGVEASFVPNPLTGRPLLATRRPGATPRGPSGTG